MTEPRSNLNKAAGALYPIMVVLMDVFWFYPWLLWLGSWPTFATGRPLLSFISVFIVLGSATLITRISLIMKWKLRLSQILTVGLGLLMFLAILQIEHGLLTWVFGSAGTAVSSPTALSPFRPQVLIVATLVLFYLWGRGIRLGLSTAVFQNVYNSFLLGLVLLIFLIIIWQVASIGGKLNGPEINTYIYVLFFFLFGLLAIAVSHLYLMHELMSRNRTGSISVWRWIPILLAVTGGIVIVALVLVAIYSPELWSTISHAISTILDKLFEIIIFVLTPFFYLFDWAFYLLKKLVDLIRQEPQTPNAEMDGGPFAGMGKVTHWEVPPIVTEMLKWSVGVLFLILLIYILLKIISRYMTYRNPNDLDETHESLLDRETLKNDLKTLLNLLKNKFRGNSSEESSVSPNDDSELNPALNVRDIYRHFLWDASQAGFSRKEMETPDEYSGRLQMHLSENKEQVAELTRLYTIVRYGDVTIEEDKVKGAYRIWEFFRTLFRSPKIS